MNNDKYFIIKKQSIEIVPIKIRGSILDIGGGGEGIIGKLNGKGVVAIDTRIEELSETKNESLKIVMDAKDLAFHQSSFDIATSFFSLMYIKNIYHQKVFEEIHGVLKNEGKFFVWDVRIPPKHTDKPIFVLPLEIVLPDETVETDYGVAWNNRAQDLQYFRALAEKTGFEIIDGWGRDEIFHLELMKRVHNPPADTTRGK